MGRGAGRPYEKPQVVRRRDGPNNPEGPSDRLTGRSRAVARAPARSSPDARPNPYRSRSSHGGSSCRRGLPKPWHTEAEHHPGALGSGAASPSCFGTCPQAPTGVVVALVRRSSDGILTTRDARPARAVQWHACTAHPSAGYSNSVDAGPACGDARVWHCYESWRHLGRQSRADSPVAARRPRPSCSFKAERLRGRSGGSGWPPTWRAGGSGTSNWRNGGRRSGWHHQLAGTARLGR
jgi:hypothetical protein